MPEVRFWSGNHVLKSSSHSIISLHDDKSTQYTCMLLQTCLTNPECLASFVDSPDAACTMESILVACSDESEHDFTLQFIQLMLRSSSVIPKVYNKLTISSQITLPTHCLCSCRVRRPTIRGCSAGEHLRRNSALLCGEVQRPWSPHLKSCHEGFRQWVPQSCYVRHRTPVCSLRP